MRLLLFIINRGYASGHGANMADSSSEDETQWLDDMDDERDPKCAPPINAKLAEMASKRFGKFQKPQTIKDLQAAFLVPQNCDGVSVPKVNADMWQTLSIGGKTSP